MERQMALVDVVAQEASVGIDHGAAQLL